LDSLVYLAAGAWALTALAAMATRALLVFSHSRLQDVCRHRHKPERLGAILQHDDAVEVATRTLLALSATATVVLVLSIGGFSGIVFWDLFLRALIATGLVLAAAVWVPAPLAALWGEAFLFHFWGVLRLVQLLMAPLTVVHGFVRGVLFRLAGRPDDQKAKPVIGEEIRSVVDEGQREGVLEPEAREMIEGVIKFPHIEIDEVMTPRTDMVCLPINASAEQACAVVRDHGHSRIPLVGQTRDDIVGILYVKDLLSRMGAGEKGEARLRDVMREPYFVPESKLAIDLLREMQQKRTHMAVVLDEYGGTSGVVTIEDIVEEIVGEITDEYDADEQDGLTLTGDASAEVDARVHVDEVNEALGIQLPEEDDYETIGGFAFSQLGRIPKVGEAFQFENIRFTILEVGKRKINRMRLEVAPAEETA